MKILINSTTTPDWPNVLIEYHKSIDLFIDTISGLDFNKDSLKILWVKEISNFSPIALKNSKMFDIILTYDDEILNKCNNSYFMPFGSTWIENFDYNGTKNFSISHLTGSKMITYGHKLRHDIHYRQLDIKNPINFYVSRHGGPKIFSGNSILGDFKNPLFESQFHICIENSNQKNLFTEKLIDALITKTIPIFWGCDNIGEFFNENGFIRVSNVYDVIEACNNINEETYINMLDYVEENYKIALKYANLSENFKNKIENILKYGNF